MSLSPRKASSFGVIIPVYRGEAWLADTIVTAGAAADPPPEIIVVDDGSPDRSADKARAQLRVLGHGRIIRQTNGGVAAARNTGLGAIGERVEACLFLDQDDLLVPGAIDRLGATLDLHPEYVAVVGRARFIDEDGRSIHYGRAEALLSHADSWGGNVSFARLAYRNCIWTPGQVLVRTGTLRACGGFREKVAPNDDWDLWLRLARLGRIGIIEEITTLVRRHAGNVSRDDEVMRTMEIALRALAYSESSSTERGQLARGYRASERGCAGDSMRLASRRATQRAPLHALKLVGRSALFLWWSIVGLRAHVLARSRMHRLTRPRAGHGRPDSD